MKLFAYSGLSLSCAAVLLFGCDASEALTRLSSSMPRSRELGQKARHNQSWMLPEAKGEDLLYVVYLGMNVYTYPAGQQVGSIPESGYYGACSDQAGNIYVTNWQYSKIEKFPHASMLPSEVYYIYSHSPYYCAVDPNTQELAVTMSDGSPGDMVAFFDPGKKKPHYIYLKDQTTFLETLTYDSHSNLFVEAEKSGSFSLIEVPKGGHQFKKLKIAGSFDYSYDAHPVQWDGKNLTVSSQGYKEEEIYRLSINGATGKIVGRTSVDDSQLLLETAFAKNAMAGASPHDTRIWTYPAGGGPTVTLYGEQSTGVAISLSSK